jgi:ribonuclease I
MGKLKNEINEARNSRIYVTRVAEICEQLNDEDNADFLNALNDATISASAIVKVMIRRNLPISENAIRAHRQRNNVAK